MAPFKKNTILGWGNVKVIAHSEDLDIDGRIIIIIIINWTLKKQCGSKYTGMIWLGIGTGDSLL